MMTSLKTWCLLSLSVLLLSVAPTLSEVVQSMTQCEGFLLEDTSPEVPGILEKGEIPNDSTNRYKVICQTYQNVKRFVTLYDTENKIPVLSAYKFKGAQGGRPEGELWNIEPQLENPKSDDNNMTECNIRVDYNNQAGDKDYKHGVQYDKGHLFPSSYGFDESDKISTFTLTNAVPQVRSFNRGSWARMESCVRCVVANHCLNNNDVPEAYLMTGAQPGTEKINEKVNVPSFLWSAFCCYSQTQDKWLASGFLANNVADTAEDVYVQTRTLQQLYDQLGTEFSAFPGGQNCPLHETVASFYPDMNKKDQNCHCEPPAP